MPRTGKTPPALLPRRADASERVARLFKIILLVHQRRWHEQIGRALLARECRCDAKTIGRDIDLLRAEGIPLEYDTARRTYTLPEKAWSYPLATLTPQDVMALALARDLVSAPGTPYAAAVRRALDNATAGLSVRLRNLLAEAGRVLLPGQLPRDYSHAPLGPLIEAAAGHQSVEIDYESRQSGRAWRRVDPYAVEARAGVYWELHGWCSDNNAVRTFALDRVRSVRPTGETFTVREAEWAAFVAQAGGIGGLRGGVDVSVAVRFSPEVAAYARARRWPSTLSVRDEPNGALLLTGTAPGMEDLLVELLRWRRHAHVLGGPELRARMTEEIRAMAAQYEEAPSPPSSGEPK